MAVERADFIELRRIELCPGGTSGGDRCSLRRPSFAWMLKRKRGIIMTYMHLSVLAIITAAFAAAWTPMAAAQTPPPQQPAPAATQTFPEEKLKSYAVAALQVEQIKQSYKPQMEATKTAQEQQAVGQESMQKQIEVVRKEGLSVEEYNEITDATQTSAEVANKVRTLMSQAAQ